MITGSAFFNRDSRSAQSLTSHYPPLLVQVALKRVGDVLNSPENAKRVLREVCRSMPLVQSRGLGFDPRAELADATGCVPVLPLPMLAALVNNPFPLGAPHARAMPTCASCYLSLRLPGMHHAAAGAPRHH